MNRFAIAMNDEGRLVYWVTRCYGTDNYSPDEEDATSFAHRSAARCIIATLGLDDEHKIIQLEQEDKK